MSMNPRTESSAQSAATNEDERGAVREDVQPGETVQESSLSTADIARGGSTEREAPPPAGATPNDQAPLFASDEAERFRSRWGTIQTGFVDDPRHTVEEADGLVAEVMKRLAEVFAAERSELEQQWER